jgi:hypothetical protein
MHIVYAYTIVPDLPRSYTGTLTNCPCCVCQVHIVGVVNVIADLLIMSGSSTCM